MPPTLPSFRRWLDQRCAAAGDGTFLEFRGQRWSYADLRRITDTIAARLHERGIAPGDRVAIHLSNGPQHLFAWLGAAKLGATVAPLHAQWTEAEVTRALTQLRPKLLIGCKERGKEEIEEEEKQEKEKAFIEGKNEARLAGGELGEQEGDGGREEATPGVGVRQPFSSPCSMELLNISSSPSPSPSPPPSPPPSPSSSPSPSSLISSFPSMKASSFSFSSSLLSVSVSEVSEWMAGREVMAFPAVPEIPAESPAELLFTSGTTGLPKAAVQSYRSMMLTGEAFAHWLRIGSSDRLFTCLPLAHVNARFYSTMGALAAGASLVLEEKFSASAFWRWISESGATVVNTIGAMLRILLMASPSALDRAHRLRLVYTSPALGVELHRAFEERFGVRLVVGYGMTECTFGFIHPIGRPLDSPDRHLDSMGVPRRHPDGRWTTDWKLIDPSTGAEASSGEIHLSGPTVFSGYFENEAATASVLRADGWLATGDLARRNEDDWWTFVGRTKEMIRRRGENLSPLEVEEVLMAHPAVAEAAVIGVPSPLGDEDVAAFVVLQRECVPACGEIVEELAVWCAARLAPFKVPSEWRLLDALPRTSTNRVAKAELRALHTRESG